MGKDIVKGKRKAPVPTVLTDRVHEKLCPKLTQHPLLFLNMSITMSSQLLIQLKKAYRIEYLFSP